MAKLLKRVQGFACTSRNSGTNGLILLEECIEHYFTPDKNGVRCGDWTPLAWLINKTDVKDKELLRRIAQSCVGGMKISKDAKQPSGIKVSFGDNSAPTEAFGEISQLILDKESFRGKAAREAFFVTKETVFDKVKYAKTVLTRIENNNCTTSELLTEITKIIAERKLNKVVEPKAA